MGGIDKMLCECGGTPLVLRPLRSMRDAAVADRVFLIANETNKDAMARVTAGETIQILVQPPRLYGSAAALLALIPVLSRYSGSVLVVDGDLPFITPETIRRLAERHRNAALDATVAAFVPSSADEGREFVSAGFLQDLHDAPRRSLCLMGAACYRWPVLRPELEMLNREARAEFNVASVPERLFGRGARLDRILVADPLEHRSVNTPTQLAFVRTWFEVHDGTPS